MSQPLLIEIGCEEIPARMIPSSAAELGRRVAGILDEATLAHGAVTAWGGSRRLTVRVEEVQAGQADRVERVLGPPASAAFDADGHPRPAATGFARKQHVTTEELQTFETERGSYVGIEREVRGKTVGQLLAEKLPGAAAGMTFPKTMRWGDGRFRWVRPVHWLLALHGRDVLPVELFDVRGAGRSTGHRFLGRSPVEVAHPDDYEVALRQAFVVVDPGARRERLSEALQAAAAAQGGVPVEDAALLEEVADLVEWPGVASGTFDAAFLDLPRELLVTTLRHHQKCFSVQTPDGELKACFLAVTNTEGDPAGHIRRGNEWVVGGRLEDARFFWNEDRRRSLEEWQAGLADVGFHARLGSYADKAERMARLASSIAEKLGLDGDEVGLASRAARLAKADLVTSLVGEFPELQGVIGGLLLRAEGADGALADAVYEHYRPQGPEDRVPDSELGCVVSVADKLDSLNGLVGAGEIPKGSRDPFGLRRAANGVMRILLERRWPISLDDLYRLTGQDQAVFGLLLERLQRFLQELGYTVNEVSAVLRPAVSATESLGWYLHDIVSRLEAIKTARGRADFELLVDLTKRVDNILTKNSETFEAALKTTEDHESYVEGQPSAKKLWKMSESHSDKIRTLAADHRYREVIDVLAEFVQPVEAFFKDVLVIDPDNPQAMLHRRERLARLRGVLTRCFDIRELAGQAERSR